MLSQYRILLEETQNFFTGTFPCDTGTQERSCDYPANVQTVSLLSENQG